MKIGSGRASAQILEKKGVGAVSLECLNVDEGFVAGPAFSLSSRVPSTIWEKNRPVPDLLRFLPFFIFFKKKVENLIVMVYIYV